MAASLQQELKAREHTRTDPVTSRQFKDAAKLAAELSREIRGEIRFDRGSRALYATDGSNYRQTPIGVVVPRDKDDVIAAVAICRSYGAPILARGCGTSLGGQCCNFGVILDMSRYMNRVIEVDPRRKLARVEPGTICDDLRSRARKYRLTYGPAPATHSHCTFGGMIGNDSCGVESIFSGRTADNVHELDILTYDGAVMQVSKTAPVELENVIRQGGRKGEIYSALKHLINDYGDEVRQRFPRIPRRVSGYNLDELLPENEFNVARALVGTESSCAIFLEATVNLVYSPPHRVLLVLGYDDIADGGDQVACMTEFHPTGLEGFDDRLVADMKTKGMHAAALKLLPAGKGWVLVEFGGESVAEARDQAQKLMRRLRWRPGSPKEMKLFEDPAESEKIWKVRESGLGAAARTPNKRPTWPGWEDSAVPPEKVGQYLRDLRKLMDKHGYIAPVYGHLGQGCIHTRIDFDLKTADGIRKFRSFVEEAADVVVSYGGSLSGEHGDGQARGELLPKMFGPELMKAFRQFKSIWDPDWKMNPGKKIDAYPLDSNLRFGADYNPPNPETHFKFPSDHNSLTMAVERCVGVGKCRRIEGGLMCPSFMVTREEKHSTRGRAHLLFEMLQGDPLQGGWKNEAVKEALDLCLSCKGCKSDCPVQVDMATYKAEFLSHYFEGRIRPRHAYAFGLIMYWAQLASRASTVVNFVTHAPVLASFARRLAGMAPERSVPRFAPMTFRDWFKQRAPNRRSGSRVILWADTFNNYFHPATAAAAVEVLEAAGFQVDVPEHRLCCGRPLYDYGFLDLAERFLHDILNNMKTALIDGTPIVILEPSCWAVFKDELTNLLPDNVDAQRLRQQVFLLSDFLQEKAPDFKVPPLHRKAILHGHCHHKALDGLASETALLGKMGIQFEQPDEGCCGMAGAFGFEEGDHYDVSMKIGERSLIPAINNASKDTLVIANGFSCREQISQTTDRNGIHIAQVIQMALRDGPAGPRGGYPETGFRYLALPERSFTSAESGTPGLGLKRGKIAPLAVGWVVGVIAGAASVRAYRSMEVSNGRNGEV